MVYDAQTTAHRAEQDDTNAVGYCLQWCREKAGIDPLYGDAATAWAHTHDRHPGALDPPRGALAYWTGGSHGYGHIAVSVGNGRIRSTDAGGAGRVATVPLAWVRNTWGLPYAGWAWDVNEITIPHGEEDDMSPDDWDKLRRIVREEVQNAKPDYATVYLAADVNADGDTVKEALRIGLEHARGQR